MEHNPWWRGNLPAETSDFVGREAEIRELLKLLAETPLVTVTGAAGVGKSRIAVRAAEECHDSYPDGAWLVELSGEHNGDLLVHIVASALGLREQSARPPANVLVEFLADKNLLLLLDTCEHLLTACRDLVTEILERARGVRIIATSRQALGLPREALLFVEPFQAPIPEIAGLTLNDALRLFLGRAEVTAPGLEIGETDLTVAAGICRLLDGIPLAVELAAGRLGAPSVERPVEQPAERSAGCLEGRFGTVERLAGSLEGRFGTVERSAGCLEDRFETPPTGRSPISVHRTLRIVVDWSHELCTAEERLLWARLSVFAGCFEEEAALWVCGDDHLVNVPDLLAGLADRSLLVRVPGGYRQPGTIREYGRERLARSGEEARLARRHRYYYLDLARQADADWYGPRQEEWAARLNFSITDLRRALGSGSPSASPAVELAGTLWILWFCLGRMHEGRHHMGRAIDAAPVTDPGLPRLLWADGCVAIAQGDLEGGRRRAEAALSAALDWDDYAAAGQAQLRLAGHSLFVGALHEVEPGVERAREYFRRAGATTVGEPLALVTMAMAVTCRGEFAEAISILEEVRRLCDARGERWARAHGDYVLSIAQLGLGRTAEAATAARQSLDVKWRFRDATGVTLAVDQLAVIAAVQGDGYRTARLQGLVVRLWTMFGLRGFGSRGMSEPRTVAERTARQLLGDDVYDKVFAEGYDDDPDSAVAYALG
ncbi:ATP-binding protein [Streptosporangium sp. NPDC000396]|uniref:ATP-binding protein n=1 Tax=Streptosporangium sp. NPDC000396 TaxID=3366185 RepID=UPI0036B91F44